MFAEVKLGTKVVPVEAVVVVYEPMVVPYFQTLDIGVEVSVTVNVFPFTPIGIVCVAVGAIVALLTEIVEEAGVVLAQPLSVYPTVTVLFPPVNHFIVTVFEFVPKPPLTIE